MSRGNFAKGMPPRRQDRWLCVAEKPSVADGLARILGEGRQRRITTRSKYNCENDLSTPPWIP